MNPQYPSLTIPTWFQCVHPESATILAGRYQPEWGKSTRAWGQNWIQGRGTMKRCEISHLQAGLWCTCSQPIQGWEAFNYLKVTRSQDCPWTCIGTEVPRCMHVVPMIFYELYGCMIVCDLKFKCLVNLFLHSPTLGMILFALTSEHWSVSPLHHSCARIRAIWYLHAFQNFGPFHSLCVFGPVKL